jgi:acyl-CoA synthetase (AMP-forming)/AMP-acid ligase II
MNKLWRVTKVSAGVERRATIGIPVPDTEIKVVEVGSGAAIDLEDLIRQDKAGELCLKGPQRMLGYWPEPGKGFDPDGYVRTGDVVKVDSNGYFSIVDRTKDMVIVSGFKVYTREIDDLLYDHPATRLAATIGVPDHERPGSERVMVFVQLREEYHGSVTEEEYLRFLSGKVAKYALPRAVTFLERIPLTTVDKVDKKALRELARNTVIPETAAESG